MLWKFVNVVLIFILLSRFMCRVLVFLWVVLSLRGRCMSCIDGMGEGSGVSGFLLLYGCRVLVMSLVLVFVIFVMVVCVVV